MMNEFINRIPMSSLLKYFVVVVLFCFLVEVKEHSFPDNKMVFVMKESDLL